MFVTGIINTTGWYVYIWIFMMEPSVNPDVHLICLVHSNGTSKLPPGQILTDRAKTSGTPDIVSGSSITVDPLDLIIFLVPSYNTDEIRGCEVST